eukprot:2198101-Prymnesium_polylepis.2
MPRLVPNCAPTAARVWRATAAVCAREVVHCAVPRHRRDFGERPLRKLLGALCLRLRRVEGAARRLRVALLKEQAGCKVT